MDLVPACVLCSPVLFLLFVLVVALQLHEYVDNTEDYVNIDLDNHRNLLQGLNVSACFGTFCMQIHSQHAGVPLSGPFAPQRTWRPAGAPLKFVCS